LCFAGGVVTTGAGVTRTVAASNDLITLIRENWDLRRWDAEFLFLYETLGIDMEGE
jgi:hypothetical protein